MRALLCAAAFLLLALVPSASAEGAATSPEPCAGLVPSGAQASIDIESGVSVEVGLAGRGAYAGYSDRC